MASYIVWVGEDDIFIGTVAWNHGSWTGARYMMLFALRNMRLVSAWETFKAAIGDHALAVASRLKYELSLSQ